jgi:hypothetical protein
MFSKLFELKIDVLAELHIDLNNAHTINTKVLTCKHQTFKDGAGTL